MPLPHHISSLHRHEYITKTLNWSLQTCYDRFWVRPPTLCFLCQTLWSMEFLDKTRGVMMEEAVAMTLYLLTHAPTYILVGNRFKYSTEIVHRQFKETVRAVCRLGRHTLHQTHTFGVHPSIRSKRK